jgi:integrase/recombinase XerD
LVESVLKKDLENNLFSFFDELINTTIAEKRLKTAEIIKECKLAILRFKPKFNPTFNEIDFTFLSKWESYMRQKGYKETTMSVYMRTLRSVYNKRYSNN